MKLIHIFIWLLLLITVMSCANSKKQDNAQINSIAEAEQKEVKQNDSDTLYQDFDRIIREKAAQWNIQFEVKQLDSTAIFAPMDTSNESGYFIKEYLYYINKDKSTKLNLNIIETASDAEAHRFIQEMKQVAASMEPFKTIFYSFRISNKIYSFRCTANISHIRLEISKEIYKKYEISNDDIADDSHSIVEYKNDSVLNYINNYIKQEMKQFYLSSTDTITVRNSAEWEKLTDTNCLDKKIIHRFTNKNDSYSLITVSCLIFNTSGCAGQYLDKLKREKDDLIKIPFFGFRIESQIYTIFVTSDIEHFRTNLYSNCIKKYKLDKNGCYP